MFFLDTQEFGGLKEVITEPMVEALLYFDYSTLRLFRKRRNEIPAYDLPAVSQDIIYDQIPDVRKSI
jgi:hypothetical protein